MAAETVEVSLTLTPTTPRLLLELAEAVTDAKVNLANAVGSPAVSTANELAAAVRLAEVERRYQDAIAFGNFTAPVAPSTTLGVPATPQASVAAAPQMAVSGVRDPEPLVEPAITEDDLAPIAPIDKLPEPPAPGGKGRGRAKPDATTEAVADEQTGADPTP